MASDLCRIELLGATVGELRQLLDELVTPGHTDLAQREMVEHRRDQSAHIALIQVARGPRDPALQVDVLQPVGDEVFEQAVRRKSRVRGLL